MKFNSIFTQEKYKAHQRWLSRDDGERLDFRNADLEGADLQDADLRSAVLQSAYLKGANLTGANIDFSAWPLWCGSFDIKVDKRIVAQLAYHFCKIECDDVEVVDAQNALKPLANQFHRIDVNVGPIE